MQKTTKIDKRMKKRNKDINLRWLGYGYKLAKKYGLAKDLIDWESLDWSLTYSEWKTELAKLLLNSGGTEPIDIGKVVEEENDRYEQQMRFLEETYYKEEFRKDIESIKVSGCNLDRYFYKMIEMVKLVVKSDVSGLVLISNGGLGKSFQVLKTLQNEGLEIEKDFVYITTYTTPLELYNILYQFRDKIVILDDLEGILINEKNISILKSALWSPTEKRIVNYYSTTEKLTAPSQFEFIGKIIMCLNNIPDDSSINSLMGRVLHYELELDYETIIKIFYELAKFKHIPFEVVDWIERNTDKATQNLNFRTLIQIESIYKYYQNNPNQLNGSSWQVISRELLKTDERLALILDLMNENISVREQVRRFIDSTGLSRRQYFYLKKKLVQKCRSYDNASANVGD